MTGETRSKVEDLRINIPFPQFNEKVRQFIEEANAIKARPVTTEAELTELEDLGKTWYENVMNLLKGSFNNPLNHIEYQFSIDCRTLARTGIDLHLPIYQRIKNRKDLLLQATHALNAKTNTLSVCDAIINYKQENVEKINRLNSGERMALILKKLYKLPSTSYYPIHEILNGNGLRIDFSETMELATTLLKSGMIDLIGRGSAVIDMQGRLWVEEYGIEQENDNNMKQKKTGKIFISHATKDKEVVSKFCDLILGNGLNITVKEIFNTSHQGTKPKTGDDFRLAIKNELINAKIVLQFISPAYKVSEACLNEMGAAWVLSENVKPLIVEKGEYEVGFIHSTTQQAQLHNEEHLIRLTDELQEEGIYEGKVKNEVLFKKIKEFVQWLNEHDEKKEAGEVKNLAQKEEEKRNFEKDIVVIKTYLQQKKLQGMTLDSLLEKVNPKYTLEYVIQLIEAYPDKLTRAAISGKPGIKLVTPALNTIVGKI